MAQIQDYLKHRFPIMSDSMVKTLSSGIQTEVDGVTDPAQRETKISNYLGKEIGFDKSLTDHIAKMMCAEVSFEEPNNMTTEDYQKVMGGEEKEEEAGKVDLNLEGNANADEPNTSTVNLGLDQD